MSQGQNYDGWQQGKSHKVKPVCSGSDSGGYRGVGTEDFSDKDNRSYHECIEGDIRYMASVAPFVTQTAPDGS